MSDAISTKPTTIAVEYVPGLGEFTLSSVNEDGVKTPLGDGFFFKHFLDAQQVALMLLSDLGDFRFSVLPEPAQDLTRQEHFRD